MGLSGIGIIWRRTVTAQQKETEIMPALWSSHSCTGCLEVLLCSCCMSPRTVIFWSSLFLSWNTKEVYRKSRETLERELHWTRYSESGNWVKRQDSYLYGSCRKRPEAFVVTCSREKCSIPDTKVPQQRFVPLPSKRDEWLSFISNPLCDHVWETLLTLWQLGFHSVRVLVCANDKTPLSLVTL